MNRDRTVEAQPSVPSSVDTARASIDQIDRRLVSLLAERMQAVAAIGAAKAERPDQPVLDVQRQQRVAELWRDEAERRELSPHLAGSVLREVLHFSHRDQERRRRADARSCRVGFQGERGCYSDAAIDRLFEARGGSTDKRGYATFAAMVDALVDGQLDYALLPVENSTSGTIPESTALLSESRLHIVDEEVLAIEHCLAGRAGARIEAVRTVRSHPVALQQCQRLLRSLPSIAVLVSQDTAGAAHEIAALEDATHAAICPPEAAEAAGLQVLQHRVTDLEHNQTRFLLLARAPETPQQDGAPTRTSLWFELRHRTGELRACLDVLATHGVNLTRIASHPLPERPWQYGFLVDLEGHCEHSGVAAALRELASHTSQLRVLGCYPDRIARPERLRPLPLPAPDGTEAAAPAPQPATANERLPLASVRDDRRRSTVQVGDVAIGGGDGMVLIAGPCAVEHRQQMLDSARMVRRHGAAVLRGGVFKPHSSPYSFQGLGLAGLDLLTEAGRQQGLPTVTEVLRPEHVAAVAERVDMLQIGARNMQNFALLQAVGQTRLPVLLKRGMSATIEELLLAAEYILREGNQRVVLCERGIRTFERATRATLDLSAVPVLRERTHLPVIVDPSHAAGRRELVAPLAAAAIAAGADGLIVEAHTHPEQARCDREQALGEPQLAAMARSLSALAGARGQRWPDRADN